MKRLAPLILLFVSCASLAESGAYRVEVIVFRNLAVMTEAAAAEELRSFSHFPALEKEVPLEDPADVPPDNPDKLTERDSPVAEAAEDDPSDDPGIVLRDDLPEDLNVVTQKSPQIDSAWRRLRSSKNYRPLLYAAWEQNRTDYYPPMRLHNQEILDTQLQPPTHIMVADLSAADPLAAYRSVFYQLDGSVQLRRSRFLHLFLDLEYRDPGLPSMGEVNIPIESFTGAETEIGTGVNYQVHALQQNRQIRTDRMQYFDTPYFGTLVLVTAIKGNL